MPETSAISASPRSVLNGALNKDSIKASPGADDGDAMQVDLDDVDMEIDDMDTTQDHNDDQKATSESTNETSGPPKAFSGSALNTASAISEAISLKDNNTAESAGSSSDPAGQVANQNQNQNQPETTQNLQENLQQHPGTPNTKDSAKDTPDGPTNGPSNGSVAPTSIAPGSLTNADPSSIRSSTPASFSSPKPTKGTDLNGSLNGSLHGNSNGSGSGISGSGAGQNSSKRLDVDNIMSELQKCLGNNWESYRHAITYYLIGKLTKKELQLKLDAYFTDKSLIHLHNRFLLANLANALKNAPQNEADMLSGWAMKQKDQSRNVKGDSQLAKLKEDIMGLSVRERRRIKAIAKDTTKRAPVPSTITSTRQAMLPKIPFINDKEKLAQIQQESAAAAAAASAANASNTSGQTSSSAPGSSGATSDPSTASASQTAHAPHMRPLGTPATWTQDIIHSYEAPLASETYELPDNDNLMTRMLGISLEHGLLRGLDETSTEVMITGLEFYLKDIIQQIFERAKHRRTDPDRMTVDDVAMALEATPSAFVEFSGPLYRLNDVLLEDEEEPTYDDAIIPPEPEVVTASVGASLSQLNGSLNGSGDSNNSNANAGAGAGEQKPSITQVQTQAQPQSRPTESQMKPITSFVAVDNLIQDLLS